MVSIVFLCADEGVLSDFLPELVVKAFEWFEVWGGCVFPNLPFGCFEALIAVLGEGVGEFNCGFDVGNHLVESIQFHAVIVGGHAERQISL